MSYEHHHQTGTIVDAEDDQVVATMSDSATFDQANLLAAAPDLLEVLKSYSLPIDTDNIALSCIEFGSEAVERELKRRAAIAKATGQ